MVVGGVTGSAGAVAGGATGVAGSAGAVADGATGAMGAGAAGVDIVVELWLAGIPRLVLGQ